VGRELYGVLLGTYQFKGKTVAAFTLVDRVRKLLGSGVVRKQENHLKSPM
jgi:hypothetical protein